jgi:ABC-type Fe3+ transport system permease subunit
MKGKLKRFIFGGEKFKKEVKHQIRLLIIITLGFTVAFTWRQTIFDSTQSLVKLITDVQSTMSLSVLSSLIITIVSLILIWITSRLLMDGPDHYT